MNIMTIMAFGVCGALIAASAKKLDSSVGLYISLFCALSLTVAALPFIGQLMTSAADFIGFSDGMTENLTVLFKAVGTGIITEISADLSEDAGENALSSRIVLAGKIAVLLLSVPVLTKIFYFLRDML